MKRKLWERKLSTVIRIILLFLVLVIGFSILYLYVNRLRALNLINTLETSNLVENQSTLEDVYREIEQISELECGELRARSDKTDYDGILICRSDYFFAFGDTGNILNVIIESLVVAKYVRATFFFNNGILMEIRVGIATDTF